MKKYILHTGLDEFRDKNAYLLLKLHESQNIKSIVLSQDVNKNDRVIAEKYKECRVYIVPGHLKRVIMFIYLVLYFRPVHIELYYGQSYLHSLCYFLIAKICRIPIFSICRGGEVLYWGKRKKVIDAVYWFLMKNSRLLLLKEPYMFAVLKERNVVKNNGKVVEVYNKVPFPDMKIPATNRDLLYLNTFKSWRYPELIIESYPYLGKQLHTDAIPNARIIGLRNNEGCLSEKEKNVIQMARKSTNKDKFSVEPFSTDVTRIFMECGIFVLPADIIFCNYALLEAMSYGLVPVVTDNDPYLDRIINNRSNGMVIKPSAEALAEALVELLENTELFCLLSKNARKTIYKRFNIEKYVDEMVQVYRTKLWNGNGTQK